jgi:hypothetical protein
MSYFDDVQSEFGNLKLWADLRHEQGDKRADRVMAALKRQLGSFGRKLESAKPAPSKIA